MAELSSNIPGSSPSFQDSLESLTQTEQDSLPELEELEELIEPLSTPLPPDPLPANAEISSEGVTFQILELIKSESQTNLYQGIDQQNRTLWIHEASIDTEAAKRLQHEAQVFAGLRCPMFPQLFACFEQQERQFLITESIDMSQPLAKALSNPELPLSQILSLLAQVAFALKELHAQGWVHLGLRPTHIFLGKPIKILGFSFATPMGTPPAKNFSHAGYSPPELTQAEPTNPQIDIYAVGAMLFQFCTGSLLPEDSADLALLPPIAGRVDSF